MNLTLTRLYLPLATTGSMTVGDRLFSTIEPPQTGDITCIPEGTYTLEPYLSPMHGETWTLRNDSLGVVGQSPAGPGEHNFVEIHTGNWAEDSRKCVIVGLASQPMTNPATGRYEPAVEQSKVAMDGLRQLLGPMTTGHTLTISS